MSIKGNYKNPEYTLNDGQTVQLRKLTNGAIMAWSAEYQRKNPPPIPPEYVMSNGDKDSNADDPRYKALLEQWNNQYTYELLKLTIGKGVVSAPPSDYEPIGISDDLKVDWLITRIDDLEDFQNAVLGLTMPTENGLESAEKN